MNLMKWGNSKIRKLDCTDVQFVKLAAMAFALLLAKLFPALLSLDWYWYLALFALFAIKPAMKVFGK